MQYDIYSCYKGSKKSHITNANFSAFYLRINFDCVNKASTRRIYSTSHPNRSHIRS